MGFIDSALDHLFARYLDQWIDRAIVRATFSAAREPQIHVENLGLLQTSINLVGYYDEEGKTSELPVVEELPRPLPGRSELILHLRRDGLTDASSLEARAGGRITGFWIRTLGLRYQRVRVDPLWLRFIETPRPD